ncbi:hypothetical protein BCR42DRAFT_404028 [Absidia repens]|uniref:Uncharacterized protein n=1 Tax=Absidia repens TaxID=90262 RepID=A0A1X2IVT8_9FUNG|nr:hypothetical protein BCR42DRAFT_404028 [Absidia repens]
MASAYQQLLSSLHLLRPVSISVHISKCNWLKHLGDTSCYQSYLSFFDSELNQYGVDSVLTYYLNSMQPSIHSQLQHLVHLTLGLEHDLPLMVSEGLAYLASTFDEASPWIVSSAECRNPSTQSLPQSSSRSVVNQCTFDYLLFDCIQSDPRFNGIMEGGRPLVAKVKHLLKNHGPLLQNYLQQWLSSSSQHEQHEQLEQQLDELMEVTLQMLQARLLDEPTHQLLASSLALRTLYKRGIWRSDVLRGWIQVQGLMMICTFLVQGRPHNTKMMTTIGAPHRRPPSTSTPFYSLQQQQDWSRCIESFLAIHPPPALILVMRSLWKAQPHTAYPSSCLLAANSLVSSI